MKLRWVATLLACFHFTTHMSTLPTLGEHLHVTVRRCDVYAHLDNGHITSLSAIQCVLWFIHHLNFKHLWMSKIIQELCLCSHATFSSFIQTDDKRILELDNENLCNDCVKSATLSLKFPHEIFQCHSYTLTEFESKQIEKSQWTAEYSRKKRVSEFEVLSVNCYLIMELSIFNRM